MPTLALFIAYLFDLKYAHSTVMTYVSALSYSHKLGGYPDPSKAFVVMQMLKGYGKLGTRLDRRLPITLPILHRLLEAAPRLLSSSHQVLLFKAMCSFAFFAFTRVGEITVSGKEGSPVPLQIDQLTKLVNRANEVEGLKVVFLDFKHHYNEPPFSLVISRQPTFCPVQILLDYLSFRGSGPGALFVHSDGYPVARTWFCSQLSSAIKFCGLNPSLYKGHSFRIGAASHAADRGMSDAQIRILGRWKSNAFHKYIRVSSLST